MKDNFTKKTWISFGIILGSIIIASAALYYFSSDLSVQANKIASTRLMVSQQGNALANLASLKSDQTKADAYAASINNFFPDQYGLVGFSPWLVANAKKYGVSVSSAFSGNGHPATQPSPSAAGSINFSLSVQGPAGSVVDFLNYIESESTGFPITLSSFDYTEDNSGGSSAEKVNAQGTLFFK